MTSRKEYFKQSKLYAITDTKVWTDREVEAIEEACRGGIDVLQLRSKVLDKSTLIRVGHMVREITLRHHVLFIVNDFPEVAREVDADGVHVGQHDSAVDKARSVLNDVERLVGKSTHNIDQAIRAERDGADYIGMGPIFSTPTKRDYNAVGLDYIASVIQHVRIPTVAIGGIDYSRVREVLERGAQRVAVVRAIFGARDIYQATKLLKDEILAYERQHRDQFV